MHLFLKVYTVWQYSLSNIGISIQKNNSELLILGRDEIWQVLESFQVETGHFW